MTYSQNDLKITNHSQKLINYSNSILVKTEVNIRWWKLRKERYCRDYYKVLQRDVPASREEIPELVLL